MQEPRQPVKLQSVIDPFVVKCGGELVSDLVGARNLPRNADYLFREYGVIAELKSLESNDFAGLVQRKFGALLGKWHRQRRFMVYGTVNLSTKQLPPDCRKELFDELAESLQKHVVLQANNQIKSTKSLLRLPEAKGLLWVASDNSAGMDPDVVWYLLRRILQKRKPTGELAYSSLHGLAYFNPRVPAKYVGGPEPLMFWFSGPRQTEDAQMTSCLLRLHEAWLPYLASSTGIRIRRVEARPEQVRFSDDKTSLTVGGKYD